MPEAASKGKDKAKISKPMNQGGVVHITEGRLLSRLLYPNPVCLLSVAPPGKPPNVMACSWLTPANNLGTFIMVINKKRHTASLIHQREGATFVLSVPTHYERDLVLRIGKATGAKGDKFKTLNIPRCPPGWKKNQWKSKKRAHASSLGSSSSNPFAALATLPSFEPTPKEEESSGSKATRGAGSLDDVKRAVQALGGAEYGTVAVKECICHIVCHVEKMLPSFIDGHWLVKAQMEEAWVRDTHWCGKNFRPRILGSGDILTFLGAQKFGLLGVPESV
uniref:Flavin reductase like domain-containing protein n=1 Tax=Lotharella oceanica TaxID=641309 RepID=A0A7S2U628_9EUKA